jgi:hypothetical protein
MLLPGAFYVFAVIIFIAWIGIAATIGFLGALAVFKLSEPILEKTQAVIWMKQGKKAPPGGWPWWVHPHAWFKIGWLVVFLAALYILAGPLYGLVIYLGRS